MERQKRIQKIMSFEKPLLIQQGHSKHWKGTSGPWSTEEKLYIHNSGRGKWLKKKNGWWWSISWKGKIEKLGRERRRWRNWKREIRDGESSEEGKIKGDEDGVDEEEGRGKESRKKRGREGGKRENEGTIIERERKKKEGQEDKINLLNENTAINIESYVNNWFI